ncbi:hypothetical protein EAO71_26500, partial [Streptomyces sp. ms191]
MPTNLCEAFQRTVAARPREPALLTLEGTALTWRQYADRVASVAAALRGLDVRRDEPVALMLTNRPEFHVADCAALHVGAVPYSLYNSLPADQIHELLRSTAARVVVTERRFLPVLRAACADTAVHSLVSVDGSEGTAEDGVLSLAEAEALAPAPLDLAAALRDVRPDDVITLIHTSGTTGRPKAVEITHRAMLSQLSGTQRVLEVTGEDGGDGEGAGCGVRVPQSVRPGAGPQVQSRQSGDGAQHDQGSGDGPRPEEGGATRAQRERRARQHERRGQDVND